MRVLGIDPGSLVAGFAVIEAEGARFKHLGSGSIILGSELSLAHRLDQFYSDLRSICLKYNPSELALEQVFFAKNAQSALKLGQARGIALLTGIQNQMQIFEYSPTHVKSSICGSGRASKDQVQHMIRILLKLPKSFEFKSTDHADALAICLTHIQAKESPILGFSKKTSMRMKGLQ